MKLSDFDYELPKELIAQYPLKERESARMLVVNRAQSTIEHRSFKDIGQYIGKDDLLVLNDTKVLPSRLKGKRKTGGKAEVLLLRRRNGMAFEALIKPARLKTGEEILFNSGTLKAVLSSRNEVTFTAGSVEDIYAHGEMPLPPYIKRDCEPLDTEFYQTVYAKNEGAVAAPTAGLHFTKESLDKIASAGAQIAYLTLHVGHATFAPVKAEDIRQHQMGYEYFSVPDETKAMIESARAQKRRIVAVGTTSCRALETYARGKEQGETNLFIYPGYSFSLVGALLTNFHLPRTTLFMLVCAFGGEQLIRRAYQEAIGKGYRFYSYGDAMLII